MPVSVPLLWVAGLFGGLIFWALIVRRFLQRQGSSRRAASGKPHERVLLPTVREFWKHVTKSKSVFSRSFYAILFFVGIGSFLVHEFAHWVTGVALGHDMAASPNHVWPRDTVSIIDQGLISAAGPLVTVVQGLAGFLAVRRGRSHLGFALLYMAFFMRLLAAGMSVFNPNDEARVSQLLGLGAWTLPLIVVGGLFILVLAASRKLKLGFREHVFCYLVASVAVTLIVGMDMAFWRRA